MPPETPSRNSNRLDLYAAVFALVLATACVLQFNQYPLERFPNWDAFWVDTQTVAYLSALRDALLQGTIPTINPYTNFGWYAVGDTTLIASAFNPIHWLVLVFAPETVIVIRTIAYFAIAAFGAYLYFGRALNAPLAGLAAGAAYLALPMNYTLLYHSNMLGFVYFTPLLLATIHGVVDRRGRLSWFWFALWAGLATASSDVYGLIALPVVIGGYSFFALLPNIRVAPARLLLVPSALILLWLAVSSFYTVPFAYNVLQNGEFARAAGLAPEKATTVAQFMRFLNEYVLWGAFAKPIDTVSIILYVPVFFYGLLAVSLTIGWFAFGPSGKRRLMLAIGLLVVALLLFAESFVFYSLPSLAASATGLLRVQIKLYSYLITLAGYLCLAEWLRFAFARGPDGERIMALSRPAIAVAVLLAIGVFSVGWDRYLFANWHTEPSGTFAIRHLYTKLFTSSNLLPISRLDVWPLLTAANLLLAASSVLAIASPMFGGQVSRKWPPLVGTWAGIAGISIACVGSVTIHNAARLQQERWAWETSFDYRIASYRQRSECVGKLTGPRNDPDTRTLYAGKQIYPGSSGRNWKAIAETELNVVSDEKVLFPYRNTIHPFVALVRDAFGDSRRRQNLWPVTASAVPQHLGLVRLLGVRWVISNDGPLDLGKVEAGALRPLGSCHTDEPELYTDEPAQGGEAFVYEVTGSPGVAFLLPKSQPVDFAPKDGAGAGEAAMQTAASATPVGEAAITAEGYGRFTVSVDAAADGGRLVVSMIDRPHWRARIAGRQAQIERGFGGFMSIEVPAGHSEVEFSYRPIEVWLGTGVSFVALLLPLMGALSARQLRLRRADHAAA